MLAILKVANVHFTQTDNGVMRLIANGIHYPKSSLSV